MSYRASKGLSVFSLVWVFMLTTPTGAQLPAEKIPQTKGIPSGANRAAEDSSADEARRRSLAISLITSLADEARSYQDLALRPRVLARAADALWQTDENMARGFFHRAWDAAEKGDAEPLRTRDNPPALVIGLTRMSHRDLRSEVIALAARRDKTLADQFLTKLKAESERESKDSSGNSNSKAANDGWANSEVAGKRLQAAMSLLDSGDIEQALEIAGPALNQVNFGSIRFLSALRTRSATLADGVFASLLSLSDLDPSSDANTVSGLSSYAFTPGFYVTFFADGTSRWSQGDSVNISPPSLPVALRMRFVQTAASILLRPVLPPDQDFTSSGQWGKGMVIRRLLPIFDQYAPDTAWALRAQLTAVSDARSTYDNQNSLITKGLRPEESSSGAVEDLQDRIDNAKSTQERDAIFADAAIKLADRGESRARDVADKIDAAELRDRVKQYVDIRFIQSAIRKKEPLAVFALAKKGALNHLLRAWAYSEAAHLLIDSNKQRAVQFLDEAFDEAQRLEASDPDRARALIGVASRFMPADPVRGWDIASVAVKAANSAEAFKGDNTQLTLSLLPIRGGIKINTVKAEEFDIAGIFRLLTKNDFYRSIGLAKNLKNEAPRATAILTVAKTVLEKQTPQ